MARDGNATSGNSRQPSVSDDGQWAIFLSAAPEYGAANGYELPIVADLASKTAAPIPLGEDAVAATSPTVSPDGTSLAFQQIGASNSVRVLDRANLTGGIILNDDGKPLTAGPSEMFFSAASSRYLLFMNSDPAEGFQPYGQASIYDRLTGVHRTVSLNNDGEPAAWYAYPTAISADGRYAFFVSDSPNLPDEDSNGGGFRLFRRDTKLNKTIQLPAIGPDENIGISSSGRYWASANGGVLTVVDSEKNQTSKIVLPNGVTTGWCQQFGTRTFVSDDAQHFVINTCQQEPYALGVVWSFDRSTGLARKLAGPDTGAVSPSSNLKFVAFDAPDSVTSDDHNGYTDVFATGRIDRVVRPQYVALGDSFSSGEGVPPFMDGTDTKTDQCHRSGRAYSILLDAIPALNFDIPRGGFRACSGATTRDVVDGKDTEPGQLDAINPATAVITISIGGNDVGFAQYIEACLTPFSGGCSKKSRIYLDTLDNIEIGLPAKLDAFYVKLERKLNSVGFTGSVYVVGYPKIIVARPLGGYGLCPVELSKSEGKAAESLTNSLDRETKAAVKRLEDPRFKYVSAIGKKSPFAKHDMCSRKPYFNRFSASVPRVFTAHPNAKGQAAYAHLIANRMPG